MGYLNGILPILNPCSHHNLKLLSDINFIPVVDLDPSRDLAMHGIQTLLTIVVYPQGINCSNRWMGINCPGFLTSSHDRETFYFSAGN